VLLRMQDQIGTIEVGKLADLVILGKDPLVDISNVRQVEMVIKDGKVI
jgi:imidazolonepropionase-like amidohydrolase